MNYLDNIPTHLTPSLLTPFSYFDNLDEVVQELFEIYRNNVSEKLQNHEFDVRFSKATNFLIPFLTSSMDTKNKIALEIGCGKGAKAIPLSKIFKEYHGFDIVKNEIDYAKNVQRQFNFKNLFFEINEAKNLRSYLSNKKFDVIVLYAIVEHLTIQEKIETLNMCWESLSDDGYLFIGEAPNRMLPIDYHSTKLSYFQQMPFELMKLYYENSPNSHWKSIMRKSIKSGDFETRALYRHGLHVGFQEFDLSIMKSNELRAHIVNDNFHSSQLNLYPYESLEAIKLLEFQSLKKFPSGVNLIPLQIPSFFSRYFIEVLLSKKKVNNRSDIQVLQPLNNPTKHLQFNKNITNTFTVTDTTPLVIHKSDFNTENIKKEIQLSLSIYNPNKSGEIIIYSQQREILFENDIKSLVHSFANWRRNLNFPLPIIKVEDFPISIEVKKGVLNVSFLFIY